MDLGSPWQGEAADLRYLADLDQIDRLQIRTPLFDDAAWELRHAVQINGIELRDTGLSDDGLRFLTELPNLTGIVLSGPFTDDAIKYLSQTTAGGIRLENTQISAEGQRRLQASLEPNRQRVMAGLDQAKLEGQVALVDQACTPLPTRQDIESQRNVDRDTIRKQLLALDKVRQEQKSARDRLLQMGLPAIPLLAEVARSRDQEKRLEAVRLLVTLRNPNVVSSVAWSIPDSTLRAEGVAAGKEALLDLKKQDLSSGLERTAEEGALIELGVLGADFQTNPVDDGMGYSLYIGYGWSGGDAGLTHLQHIAPLRSLQLATADITGKGLAVLKEIPDLTGLELMVSDFDEQAAAHIAALHTPCICEHP